MAIFPHALVVEVAHDSFKATFSLVSLVAVEYRELTNGPGGGGRLAPVDIWHSGCQSANC